MAQEERKSQKSEIQTTQEENKTSTSDFMATNQFKVQQLLPTPYWGTQAKEKFRAMMKGGKAVGQQETETFKTTMCHLCREVSNCEGLGCWECISAQLRG